MSTATAHRRLAAIVFTDMVGYSALSQRNEALALELLEEHRRIVRNILPGHGGREVKTTGDGFLIEFPSALAAVQCALEIQEALRDRNQGSPPERKVQIRIGIHVGDVVLREGDVHGDGVNIAARIEPLAQPGGICVTRAVFEQIENKVPQKFIRLSAPELKNISANVEVYRLIAGATAGDSGTAARSRKLLYWLVLGIVVLNVVLFAKYGLEQKAERAGQPAATNAPATVSVTTTNVDAHSLAVLAFANLSQDKDNEYFSDGVSEELLNVLAKLPGLKVPARTSAFAFKGRNVPATEIARQLGVAYVLEGSVRKAGNRVRITAQLIKAADGFQVWSETFDRDLKDIFALQDEIASLIAHALQLHFSPEAGLPVAQGATQNAAAYEAFLRGRQAWNSGTQSGFQDAVLHFQTAIGLDTNFALAHGALAEAYVSLGNTGQEPAKEAFSLARASAERALALNEHVVQAYTALAEIAFHYDWDYAKSDEHLQQALSVNPNYASAHARLAGHLEARNRLEEALAETRRANELDPLDVRAGAARTLFLMNRYAEAITAGRQEVAANPASATPRENLAMALWFAGRREEALNLFETLGAENPSNPSSLSVLGWAYGQAGQNSKAREVMNQLTTLASKRFVSPLVFALVAAGMNDRDAAFAYLEKAYELRDPMLPTIGIQPELASIRDDPRFRDLLKRLNLQAYFPESVAK